MRSPVALRSAVCIVVGGLGGAAVATSPRGSALGGLYGLLFALLVTPRAGYAGAGLLWGLAYALVIWLAIPAGLVPLLSGTPHMAMLDTARAHFHDLVAYLLYLGLPLGLAHGLGGWIPVGGRGR